MRRLSERIFATINSRQPGTQCCRLWLGIIETFRHISSSLERLLTQASRLKSPLIWRIVQIAHFSILVVADLILDCHEV